MAFGITAFAEDSFAALGGTSVNAEVTGVSATGAIGTTTVVAEANISVTGVVGTSALGSATTTADANTSVTGEQATGNLGSVTVIAEANVSVTGVAGTSALGSATVSGDANISVTGVSGTSALGSVTVTADANVSVTGVVGTSALGTASVTGDANISVTGVVGTSALGSVTTTADANPVVTGVSATAAFPTPITFSGSGDAQISTAQSKFGGASLLLDGSGDYLESQETYNFSNDPFTIDVWVRPANGTQDAVFFDSRDSTSNDTIALRQASDNLLVLRGNGTLFNINNVFSTDTWVQISVTRGDPFGNTYRVFVNGVEEGSTLFGVTASAANIHIGSDFNGSNNWAGYLDELRISNVDRYDGNNFTPPSSAYTADDNTPILLHFDGANGSTTFTNDGFVQAVTVTADANVSVTGVAGTSALGSTTVRTVNRVPVTGVQATGAVGTADATGLANVYVIGVSGTCETNGFTLVWGEIDTDQTANWVNIGTSQSPNWVQIDTNQSPNWKDIAA